MEAMNTASLHSWLKSGWTCQHQPAQPSQCIECAGEIAPFLGHPNNVVRFEALNSLGNMGNAALPYVAGMTACLQTSDPCLSCKALQVLSRIGQSALPYISRMIALLQDADPDVRCAALQAVGAGSVAVKTIEPLLQDGEPDVRRAALQTMGRIHTNGTSCLGAPAITAFMEDPSLQVKITAITLMLTHGLLETLDVDQETALLQLHSNLQMDKDPTNGLHKV